MLFLSQTSSNLTLLSSEFNHVSFIISNIFKRISNFYAQRSTIFIQFSKCLLIAKTHLFVSSIIYIAISYAISLISFYWLSFHRQFSMLAGIGYTLIKICNYKHSPPHALVIYILWLFHCCTFHKFIPSGQSSKRRKNENLRDLRNEFCQRERETNLWASFWAFIESFSECSHKHMQQERVECAERTWQSYQYQ